MTRRRLILAPERTPVDRHLLRGSAYGNQPGGLVSAEHPTCLGGTLVASEKRTQPTWFNTGYTGVRLVLEIL